MSHILEPLGFSTVHAMPALDRRAQVSATNWYRTFADSTLALSKPLSPGIPSGYLSDRNGFGSKAAGVPSAFFLLLSLAKVDVPHGGEKCT